MSCRIPPGLGRLYDDDYDQSSICYFIEVEFLRLQQGRTIATTSKAVQHCSIKSQSSAANLSTAFVHIKWWGDVDGDGHFINPSSKNPADRKIRYAIHCDNGQLQAYLADMQTLPLKLYSTKQASKRLLGIAYVDSLDLLPLRKTISGSYPVISNDGELITTLKIYFRLIDRSSVVRRSMKHKDLPSKSSVTSKRQVCLNRKPSSSIDAGHQVFLTESKAALQNTVSSLIERSQKLKYDITKLLLADDLHSYKDDAVTRVDELASLHGKQMYPDATLSSSSFSSSSDDLNTTDSHLDSLIDGLSFLNDQLATCAIPMKRSTQTNPKKQVAFNNRIPRTVKKPMPLRLPITKTPSMTPSKNKPSGSVKRPIKVANSNLNVIHCELLIPEGFGFAKTITAVYLSSRTFWDDHVVKSELCWPTSMSSTFNSFSFGFRHEGSTILTESKLESRIRDNVIVVEVWQKLDDDGDDRLIGTCKLPLQLIYTAFMKKENNEEIKVVMAIDDQLLPVSELLTGRLIGRLRVLLAVGTVRRRVIERLGIVFQSIPSIADDGVEICCVYEVTVKSVTLTRPPSNQQVWGESNCRIEYHLSHQPIAHDTDGIGDGDACAANMKPMIRLTRILCEPVMHWNSSSEHVIQLPSNSNNLVTKRSSGGFVFRVISTRYYPIECDQLISEVHIPLTDLRLFVNEKTFNLDLCDKCSSTGEKIGSLNVHIRKLDRPSNVDDLGFKEHRSAEHKATNTSIIWPNVNYVLDTIPTKENQFELQSPMENKQDDDVINVIVHVERAVNLHNSSSDRIPNAYVTLGNELVDLTAISTDVVSNNENPSWNFTNVISRVPLIIFLSVHHCKSTSDGIDIKNDELIGRVSVDLSPLKHGLPMLCGWYNIIDDEANCRGQLKIIVQPTEALNHKPDIIGNDRPRYMTAGSYVQFPSHIGQFIEQTINCCQPQEVADELASRSFLVDNLRQKLNELDDLLDVGITNIDGLKSVEPSSNFAKEVLVDFDHQSTVTSNNEGNVLELTSDPKVKGKTNKQVTNRKNRVAAAIYNNNGQEND